jgi:hypothetical protein
LKRVPINWLISRVMLYRSLEMGSTLRSITLRSITWAWIHVYMYIILYILFFFVLWTCSHCVFFSLWQMLGESEVYTGFADGSSRHTWRLSFATWVIFIPFVQLVSSRVIFLGETTNNIAEYSARIELLRAALSHGIYCL